MRIIEREMGMANYRSAKDTEAIKRKVLVSAAKLFLTKGYTFSTIKEIAAGAGVKSGTMVYVFKTKEDILCELVNFVLDGQFEVAKQFVSGKTNDKLLYYAAETTLQLYMAESSENVRELYSAAYSMPKSSDIIQHHITEKLEDIFKEYLPDFETKDFFELEIASGSVIRGFMAKPCDLYFTMDRKVKRYLEITLRIFDIPKEKIEEAITFVQQFDYPKLAQETINTLLKKLEAMQK